MRALQYLNRYFIQYKFYLLGGFILIILNNLFGTLVAPLSREVINLVADYSKFPNKESFTKELLFFSLLIIGSAVLSGIFLYFQRKILIGMSRYIEFEMKNEIYRHYQTLPLSFYKKNNTGDLMNRISEDVSQVRQYIGPSVMYFLNMVVVFAITIPFMLSVSLKLTLFTLLPLPFLVLSIYVVHHRMTKQSEAIQSAQSGLSAIVQESFSGIRVIKSFTKEATTKERLVNESEKYKKHSVKLSTINALFFPVMMTIIGLSNLLIIYIGGMEVIAGNIKYGHITEFIIYLNKLTWPVTSLGWITSLIQRAEVSQRRINEFLETKTEINSGSESFQTLEKEIEFRNVRLTYPDTGITALNGINFKLQSGKTLAVVGNTGSGKSSLALLLARMYDPNSGEILIDGKNLNTMNMASYRNKIGYVPQDVFLFSDSIAKNIAFGTTQSSTEAIRKAAIDADLYDNIQQFPNGLETVIGERGITLSGGQKQRLSIARALVREPQILILDDCLSAVDTKTENAILQNLEKIMKGKTNIIISHRVSSVKLADQILFLEDGSIVESGTHQELMQANGRYKLLYEKQTEENV